MTIKEIKSLKQAEQAMKNAWGRWLLSLILGKGTMYEITTFRQDGEYEDSRRPNEVFFTRSFEEDVKRRDFTINSLGYSPLKGIIDFEDGISDLMAKKIKAVGDADKRFELKGLVVGKDAFKVINDSMKNNHKKRGIEIWI